MSLVRMVTRLIAVEAIVGRTMVGENVQDSVILELDKNAAESTKPFIAVYTDDSGKRQGENSLELVFEIGVSAKMEDNGKVVGTGIPSTDYGFEIVLDTIERQIHVALADPENEWAQLLLRFAHNIAEIKSQRGADTENGVRFAARRITISADVLCDPAYGKAPAANSAWEKLLAKMDATTAMAETAALLRSLLGTDEADAEPWVHQQRAAMLSIDKARALLITPEGGTTPPDTVFSSITGVAEPQP